MWMQQSVENTGFGNSHERNRFGGASGSRMDSMGGSYMGGGGSASQGNNGNGDWKSKILESGQWLGGKVIEYGGKLARGGSSHETIPDHASYQPRNDGRANWMADIRNSSSSYSSNSYSNGAGSTYQNDFVTERPKAYSDSLYSSSRPAVSGMNNAPFCDRTNSHENSSGRRAKKSKGSKLAKKGKKKHHSKRRDVSESEESDSPSESEASGSVEEDDSVSDGTSDSNFDNTKHRSKSKGKSRGKKASKRPDSISSSEEEDSLEAKPKGKQKSSAKPEKAPADYSFSFDPAKIPPPPSEESSSKSLKKDKKSSKSSRGRRQSVESSESELSDKENQRTKKVTLKSKTSSKKSAKAKQETVDLLGVEFDATPVVQHPTLAFDLSAQQPAQPDIFSQSLDPLQDLAGLNFSDTYSPMQQAPTVDAGGLAQLKQQVSSQSDTQVLKKLLPENNIIDLDSLASEKKKSSASTQGEAKTLNELQRAKLNEQPQQYQQTPSMLMQQQQVMGMPGQLAPTMMMQQQMQMQMQMQMNQMGQMGHMNGMMRPMHM